MTWAVRGKRGPCSLATHRLVPEAASANTRPRARQFCAHTPGEQPPRKQAPASIEPQSRDIAQYDTTTQTTTVENHIVYDCFGNIIDVSDGANVLLFGYTGRPFDIYTGLQNNLNRWYEPIIAGWLSEDPIGFEAGDANLRRYVGNGPLNATDPGGLEELPAARSAQSSPARDLHRELYTARIKHERATARVEAAKRLCEQLPAGASGELINENYDRLRNALDDRIVATSVLRTVEADLVAAGLVKPRRVEIRPRQRRNSKFMLGGSLDTLLFAGSEKSNIIPLNTQAVNLAPYRRKEHKGGYYMAEQGHHVVVSKSGLHDIPPENRVVGTTGCGPCIGVVVYEPGDYDRIFAFRFEGPDNAGWTLGRYRFRKGSVAVVCGGDTDGPPTINSGLLFSDLRPRA